MASKPGSSKGKGETKKKAERLPFEPASSRKKATKKDVGESSSPQPAGKAVTTKTSSSKSVVKSDAKISSPKATKPKRKYSREETAIPEEVSRRMIKRMALFCGVPTAMGISSFIISYFIVINDVIELPPIAVLLMSLGFFGLGVVGLSYGALSTSWDLGNEGGSLLGWDEFRVNIGRMKDAWQESRNQSRS